MSHQKVLGIQFATGADKVSLTARVNRGIRVGTVGKQSAIYSANADVKSSVDTVAVDTTALKAGIDTWNTAEAAAKKARTALVTLVGTWDGSYDILVATGEKGCTTADDGTSLGMDVRGVVHNALAVPLGIRLTQDFARSLLRIRILRAPGMTTCDLEMSPDPIGPATWTVLDGNGALHVIPLPAKGTWWFRAASRTAKGKSDYTTPISVVIT